ncbi:MAG: hypothetical protein QGI53_08780 [SAR324 cluster bacterium]|jgi:uncharacterized membrane protein|nr:hypothetical protein [SAR324 cluster bacterium]MDP7171491.1 hypothetical protein [SAR324 cluster bacterium]MDP7439521.1 hypothetical protein [SAR324 cluster bacterium]MDP7614356.1 hypothetical protein [SAR324 cluster bacterium]|tara:strand:+ start:718 stop:1218 length:501 start_codon:yes stop_codon:yes gene_type:complete
MNYNYFVLARIFHVLAVVLWIGGVGFVTTVLIPSISKTEEPAARLKIFEAIENKFGFQAKLTTLVAGISGVYMLEVTDGWSRYLNYEFWWLHLMTFVWAVFTLVLFILEPLFLQKWFHRQAEINSEKAFQLLQIMHVVLLSLSILAIVGAIGGSHGFTFKFLPAEQ